MKFSLALGLSTLLPFSTVRYRQSTVKGDNLGKHHAGSMTVCFISRTLKSHWKLCQIVLVDELRQNHINLILIHMRPNCDDIGFRFKTNIS